MEETLMKKTLAIGLALVALSAAAFAADPQKSITINGGRNTVYMGAYSTQAPAPCTKGKFYDNICGGTINTGSGWTISDGSPIGTQYSPAGLIVALKTGETTKIGVTVGFVEGTNGATVYLTKDCKGLPCSSPDGKPKKDVVCSGKIKDLFTFGDAYTVETFKCKAKLTKGHSYWVWVDSDDNSWLAWDQSAATGGLVEGTNDVWGTASSGQPVGGLAIY
jgi:hypothetical protein